MKMACIDLNQAFYLKQKETTLVEHPFTGQYINVSSHSIILRGMVNDQFHQILALKSEELPDAVVKLIDTYILDVEMILSNLKGNINLPGVDISKLAVEISKIEEKSSQIGAEHMKISCVNLIKACDQSHKDNFWQYLAWLISEFTQTRSKLEAYAQMERKIIRVRSKAQK